MKYTVIDIETTGLYPEKGAEITEIAGCNVIDGEVLTTFSSTIKITGIITEYIKNLTGITNEMCKNSNDLYDVFIKFIDTLNIDKNTNLVIHNSEFDYNFILYHVNSFPDKLNEYVNRFKSCNIICTLELSRKLLPDESHKLESLKRKFGINTKSHRALNDVLATNKIYQKLLELEDIINEH